jgi:hypothetical protein
MYHPIFDQFTHLIESNTCVKPTIDDIRKAKEFLSFTTLLWMSERECNPEITRREQFVLEPHEIADSLVHDFSPDGASVVKINGVELEIPTFIIELKSLLGDSGMDASIQVGRSTRKAGLQPKVSVA